MLRPRLAVQIAIRGVSKEGRKDKQTDRWTDRQIYGQTREKKEMKDGRTEGGERKEEV